MAKLASGVALHEGFMLVTHPEAELPADDESCIVIHEC